MDKLINLLLKIQNTSGVGLSAFSCIYDDIEAELLELQKEYKDNDDLNLYVEKINTLDFDYKKNFNKNCRIVK